MGGSSCWLGGVAAAQVAAILLAGPLTAGAKPDERRMLEMINEERQSRGLEALAWNDSLSRLARSHARDMKRMGKATHHSRADGALFSTRLARSGLKAAAAAENVAFDRDVESAHRGLMRSPGHRANLLDERLTTIGIGIVPDDDGASIYVVQDFATPMVDLSDAAALAAVRRAVISAHGPSDGIGLPEDTALSDRLAGRLEELIAADSVEIQSDMVGGPAWVAAYTSMNPAVLPGNVLERAAGARAFGAAVAFRKTPSYEFGIYWVLLALVEP